MAIQSVHGNATIQALAAITDEGLFERIATAVLRLVPDYEGIAHTGINADGKTRKSPVDGLRFIGEGSSRLIMAHHTITASDGLDRKWLLDPATVTRRKGSKSPPPPGDVIKSIEIVKAERRQASQLAATLILATNQEPDEALIRKAVAAGRATGMTVDIWTRSRIAAKLDLDPRGQFIRRKLLGIEAELLSRPLLEELGDIDGRRRSADRLTYPCKACFRLRNGKPVVFRSRRNSIWPGVTALLSVTPTSMTRPVTSGATPTTLCTDGRLRGRRSAPLHENRHNEQK